MIKLEISFNNLEEVVAFIENKKVPTEATISLPSEAVKVEAAPAAVKKKYTDEELLAMSDEEAESVLKPAQKGKRTKLLNAALQATAPAPIHETAAAVMQAAPAPEVTPALPVVDLGIDRDALINKASGLVNYIKELGVPEGEIMPKLMSAYQAAGVMQFCRVSELSDTDLPNVVAKIEELVKILGAPQAGSFI